MESIKRKAAWLLAMTLCLSSLLQPYGVWGAEMPDVSIEGQSGQVSVAENSGQEGAGEGVGKDAEKKLQVSIENGKGKILLQDGTGYLQETDSSCLVPVVVSEGTMLQVTVTPEVNFEIASYKTLMDGGAVKEEITDLSLLNEAGSFQADIKAGEVKELKVSFREKEVQEEAGENQLEGPLPEEALPEEAAPGEVPEEEKLSEENPAETDSSESGVSAEEGAMYKAGLIPAVEPNQAERAGDTMVTEYGSNTLKDVAGVSRESILNWLGSKVSTNYYLSTPYNPGWIENSGMSADYRNPNGDCEGAYGAGDTAGQAGMNCTGFVWHALTKAGGTDIPALSGWVSFLRNNDIKYRTYTGSDTTDIINTILYQDDWIEPGDIIWMWDANAGQMQDGLSYGVSNYHHVGIYVGAEFDNSNPYNEKPGWFHKSQNDINGLWHSTDHGIPGNYEKGNMISNILPKTACTAITVVKTDTAEAKGGISITKSSAKPEFTNGNSCYTLQGAKYGIFERNTSNQVAEIITDENGYGRADNLPAGEYDIKELEAPRGYALDSRVGQVTVTASQIVTYQCSDKPQSDPVSILLGKVDKETNQNKPQGSASLANAEFTIKYYAGIYDTDPAQQSIQAKGTWIVKTDDRGFTRLSDKYKVSGDDFYFNSYGEPTLPLGTITIQETKAPKGYLQNSEIFVRKITSQGSAERVDTYNQPTIPEQVQKGVIRLQKVDAETGGSPSAAGSLEGAVYEVFNAAGEKTDTLTTNAEGKAQSKELPVGTYTLKEKTPSPGYMLDTQTYTITFSGDTSNTPVFYKDVTSRETPQKGRIRLQKTDKETGSKPAGDGTLEKAEYEVFNSRHKKVDTLITDREGKAQSKELPLGTYTVKESRSSAGYIKDPETYTVTLTGNQSNTAIVYADASSPETPQKGIIRLEKKDYDTDKAEAQGKGSLKGAVYEIRDSGGNVTDTLTTDENGKAQSKELLLGTYTVKEKSPSPGYELDMKTYDVKLTSENREERVFYQTAVSRETIIRGGVSVEKWDSEKDKREPQGGADFEDTRIQILSRNEQAVLVDGKTYKKGEVITTLVTDKDGRASTGADYLPYGDYQLKETVPPTGYTSAGTITRNFEIREKGKLVRMNTADTAVKNEVIRGGVAVEKWDKELNQRIPQGDAGLEGAKLQIISNNPYTVIVGQKEYKKGEAVAVLTTDKDGKAATSADFLPYGDYQLKETVPPTGYTSGGTITRNFKIREDGKLVQMNTADTAVKNEAIRGGVTIAKWSLETKERKPQGGAALEGAKFTITNRSAKAVLVDGQRYEPGEVLATVETDKNGLWTSAKDWLPYGTYEVVEIQAPDGYLPEGAEPKTFQIREDGKIVSLDNPEGAVKNQVKRGDLKFVKVADSTLERLSEVPFKITSKTTGEAHTVVSDVNGQVDTSSAWNPHSQNTNRGETSEDGVWFSGSAEKEVPVNDNKGALPYDTYLIEEQRCEANEGYKLLSIEIKVYRDNYTIPLGTLTDDSDRIEISTTAVDSETESHYAAAGKHTVLVDTVEYTNLKKGEEYTLKGILMNKAAGEPVTDAEGNPVTAEKTFTAKKVSGSVEMEFTFDSRALAGADVVVFEELYQKENLIAEHTDITDEDQTLHFPEIGTKAMNQETNTNAAKAAQKITLIDTVSYRNLQPGKKYKLTGTLMDKETGEPVKDTEGKEITAETSFKPETADGTVKVTFTFNGSNLAGKTIVVFESLERNDAVYAVHTDINDQAQTIYFPEIGTIAKDAVSGTHFSSAGKVTLVDTVSYSNLTPGTEYILKGVLMNQETGESVKAGGREVTAETTFKPEEASGTVEVTFAFDASSLEGHTLVVFEELYQAEASITEHKDIKDRGQTIYIPKISTTALDQESGSHNSNPDSKVTIVDTVAYQGLIPGKEYTVKGTLMDKSAGKELLADGKPITAEKTFTAEKAEGAVELTFTFDGSALAGKTVVVFEHVYYEGKEVGTHTDLEDEDQSIRFTAVKTTAKDSSTKEHMANAGKITIIDTVAYQNLIPNRKYTLKGVLMDKETEKELLIGEKAATAEKAFTPKEANGSVDLEYTFDASALAGRRIVVYEELYTNGSLIGGHKNIHDEGQTVRIPQLHTKASDGVTGTHTGTVNGKAAVVDTVTYKNLIPGREYTVKGILMNQETGEPVKDREGRDITAEKTFTAEKADGSAELVYELDSTLLAGKTVVVFEDLLYNGVKIGSHADLNDEGQSVHYPELGTKAKNQATGTRESAANKSVTILDTVSYQNVIPGREYVVKGILMDKSTGKELLVGNKTVTAGKSFTPEKAEGSVELAFTFDGSNLTGKTVVVFERLYAEEKEVAAHADITDKGQTIEFPVPEIGTRAKDRDTGTGQGITKEQTTIVDTVSYKRLVPGTEYTIKGSLMDKETKEPLLINEKQVTAEKTFTPEKAEGSIELAFTFDSQTLKGKAVVVFERLYVQGTEAAVHADINDKNQTVAFRNPPVPVEEKPKPADNAKTGDSRRPVFYMLLAAGAGTVAAGIKKKGKKQKKGNRKT